MKCNISLLTPYNIPSHFQRGPKKFTKQMENRTENKRVKTMFNLEKTWGNGPYLVIPPGPVP